MEAQASMGTKLYLVEGLEETPIAYLFNLGEIGGEADEIDTTDFDSPNGYKESIPGLKDGGEVPYEGNLKDSEAYSTLLDLFESQEVKSWKVEFTNGDTHTFSAWVKTCKEGESTVEGKRTFNGTLRVTGKPTFTENAPSA